MIMMEYGSQFSSSLLSSETLSGTCSSRSARIRTVRLIRPNHASLPPPGLTCRHGPSLGFSIRGGREHGTGFFVSYVELCSEAHRQGLRVGDQIVRINGFTIDDAVHKEVLQLVSNHTHLTLKVRSVGMIPVKDKKTDPLSWQIISDCNSSLRSSPPLSEKIQDVRISMIVAPRSKLGCGICKGPEWKPGIFVQFTKEGGIAREAGLRPGDQILYCNNVDFSDIPFNEAVNLMKTSHQLDLIVRKSAGSELFPGESSGYNSSASSVTGDQSPSWSDSKRLSIVKEESLDLEDRLNNLDRIASKKWDKIEWDDTPRIEEKVYFKPTVINLSESGTIIQNNGVDEFEKNVSNSNNTSNSKKIADICLVSQQHEHKTVVVEVHRSDNEDKIATKNALAKSASTNSFNSLGSQISSTSSSLSSAICQEIQRRSEKINAQKNKAASIDEQIQMKKILKGIDSDKQHQHNKLMDEFRKAHRKMFNSSDVENDVFDPSVSTSKQIDDDQFKDRNMERKIPVTVQDKLLSTSLNEASQERPSTFTKPNVSHSTMPPPPPPPLPFNNEHNDSNNKTQNGSNNTIQSNTTKRKSKAPPVPVKTSTLSSYSQPPPCPTPDYDNLSINSVSTLPKQTNGPATNTSQNISDVVEMESLESFKLKNPTDIKPKPPNTYFYKTKPALSSQLSNGSTTSTSTMRKQQRPVSVTIGEYPSGTVRKQPSRFDFLQNGLDENGRSANQPITSQLASELAFTLSRSNLRKRNEIMENTNSNSNEISSQCDGTVRIAVNNNLKRNGTRATNELSSIINMDNLSKALANRLTINVNNADKKTESPNGILKNGNGNTNISLHRPVVHQKSITFGEQPTIINDGILHIT